MSSIDVVECFQLDFLISKDSAQFFTSIFSPFLCLLCRFHRKESIDGNTFLSLDFFFTLSLAHFFWEYSRNKKSHFFFFFIIIIIFFIGTRWFQVFTWLLPANTSNQLTRRKSVQIYGRFSFFFVCCYAGGQEVVVDFFFLPFSSFLFVFMRLTTPFGSTSSFDSFHFLSFFFISFASTATILRPRQSSLVAMATTNTIACWGRPAATGRHGDGMPLPWRPADPRPFIFDGRNIYSLLNGRSSTALRHL